MKLFDFGNSRYKWADINDVSVISTREYDQAHPVETIVSVINAHDENKDVYAISVRPESFNRDIAEQYGVLTGRKIHFLSYQADLLRINYSEPKSFGIDRFAAMLGVQAKGLYPSIIVDAGTAVTIDVVDAKQRHIGGCILPGRRLMLEAMTNKSPALKYMDEQDVRVPTLLGSSTQGCMISGVARSVAGAIFSTQVSLGQEYSIQVTGGDAQWVLDSLQVFKVSASLQSSILFEGMKQMIRGQY